MDDAVRSILMHLELANGLAKSRVVFASSQRRGFTCAYTWLLQDCAVTTRDLCQCELHKMICRESFDDFTFGRPRQPLTSTTYPLTQQIRASHHFHCQRVTDRGKNGHLRLDVKGESTRRHDCPRSFRLSSVRIGLVAAHAGSNSHPV